MRTSKVILSLVFISCLVGCSNGQVDWQDPSSSGIRPAAQLPFSEKIMGEWKGPCSIGDDGPFNVSIRFVKGGKYESKTVNHANPDCSGSQYALDPDIGTYSLQGDALSNQQILTIGPNPNEQGQYLVEMDDASNEFRFLLDLQTNDSDVGTFHR